MFDSKHQAFVNGHLAAIKQADLLIQNGFFYTFTRPIR
jgi:hypothetical protein